MVADSQVQYLAIPSLYLQKGFSSSQVPAQLLSLSIVCHIEPELQ